MEMNGSYYPIRALPQSSIEVKSTEEKEDIFGTDVIKVNHHQRWSRIFMSDRLETDLSI